jgi:hypothetical protein
MSTTFDSDAVQMLLEQVASEGEPRLYLPGDDLPDALASLPSAWRNLVTQDESPADFVHQWWKPLGAMLPATIELLERKTSVVALLLTRTEPPSLVYCFGTDKTFFASRGYLPLVDCEKKLHPLALATDLTPLYIVHDGWVDFFSGDGGPSRFASWRKVGGQSGSSDSFLEVYVNGSSSAGFDLTVSPAPAYSLLPDENEVEPIPDFWAWLDDALATTLEDLDDAAEAA